MRDRIRLVGRNAIYKAALAFLSGPDFRPYLATDIEAATDTEAADMAMEWASRNAAEVFPQTWLRVTSEGRSICSEKLGWNNPPRP